MWDLTWQQCVDNLDARSAVDSLLCVRLLFGIFLVSTPYGTETAAETTIGVSLRFEVHCVVLIMIVRLSGGPGPGASAMDHLLITSEYAEARKSV